MATNMTRPAPRLLTPEQLADIRCTANSGLVELADVLALLDDRELLRQSLVMRASRLAMSGEDSDG